MTATELVASVPISTVWTLLGGGELRHGRGQAHWRDGDGYSVALNDEKGIWFDHRDAIGGGVLDLVVRVKGGSRKDALTWLAAMNGVAISGSRNRSARADRRARSIAREAYYFAITTTVMTEEAKESTEPFSDQWAGYSSLLHRLRISAVAEYRLWRKHSPKMAAALVHAGRQRQRRLNTMLARFIAQGTHAA